MHPVLIEIFGHKIYTYGPLMALGFLTAFFLMFHLVKLRGDNLDFYMDLYFYSIILGLIGAKLLYNIVEFEEFLKRPLQMWNCREGGLVWYGGVILCILFIFWYAKRKGHPALRVMDTLSAPLALGLAIGRWGCLMGGCCYGHNLTPRALGGAALAAAGAPEAAKGLFPWFAVSYPLGQSRVLQLDWRGFHWSDPAYIYDSAVAGHTVYPTPLFESAAALLIALVIYLAIRANFRRGAPTLLWLTLYPLARFIIEFYRGDKIRGFIYEGGWLHLSTSQFISVLILAAAIAGWVFIMRREPVFDPVLPKDQRNRPAPESEDPKPPAAPPPKKAKKGKSGRPRQSGK